MNELSFWEWSGLAVVAFIAVSTLVGMMARRHDQLLTRLRNELRTERERVERERQRHQKREEELKRREAIRARVLQIRDDQPTTD